MMTDNEKRLATESEIRRLNKRCEQLFKERGEALTKLDKVKAAYNKAIGNYDELQSKLSSCEHERELDAKLLDNVRGHWEHKCSALQTQLDALQAENDRLMRVNAEAHRHAMENHEKVQAYRTTVDLCSGSCKHPTAVEEHGQHSHPLSESEQDAMHKALRRSATVVDEGQEP